jgi:hypothetical protein
VSHFNANIAALAVAKILRWATIHPVMMTAVSNKIVV